MSDFWEKVHKTATCWLWTGSIYINGYGCFCLSKKFRVRAHRFSYELAHGPIPATVVIDHTCSNRLCVNPLHLEAISNGLNIGRGTTGKNTRKNSRNRFRNVYRIGNRWEAMIGGKPRIYGGLFVHEEVAAMQVNVLSAHHFPGFRAFNLVEMG